MTIVDDSVSGTSPLSEFQWKPEPEAERFVAGLVETFLAHSPLAKLLASRMIRETGTRFHDWIDHIAVVPSPELFTRLAECGYLRGEGETFIHPGGVFPLIRISSAVQIGVTIKVDSITDFAAINGLDVRSLPSHAESPTRSVVVWQTPDHILAVVEHRGAGDQTVSGEMSLGALDHVDAFRVRQRQFESGEVGFVLTGDLIDRAIGAIGQNWACDLFFAAEREFWMRRNRAAQVQYARQQRLGLGWANHDHHTYRSSREHFARLIAIWEKLGFVCRERFYAGAEAGWGAQVMEHSKTGIVTFNDVDLSPDELMQDFAHEPLEPRKELGTVGLWCALHGESFLEAGMHHLECMFDFDALKQQLEGEHAVKVMKPFTDFPHLRQAFTEGERWAVRPEPIERLLNDGQITLEQAGKFRIEGAIGSHLENLERNAGFKGFNQKGVSEIIAATDPRKQV
jgi:hypothetical protein